MKFPFKDSENLGVLTCSHILEKKYDICYVTHDEDDSGWQFLCNKHDHTDSDVRIVSLKNIFEFDSSIGILTDMPLGCGAIIESKEYSWKGFRK
ncbi:hypothetical protein [Fusobacterium sp. PH5-44]|uniref:hypothetical protein n=1 Tax=unclassified Fusobacterium TaxID=2648384 RepID=UPI003D1A1324